MKQCALCIMLIFSVMMAGGVDGADKPVGKILQLSGDVDITADSGKRKVPREGTVISEKDRIRTGRKSFVSIILNDGSTLFIREISVVHVQNIRLSDTGQPTRIEMFTGKLRVIAAKTLKGQGMFVATPTAIAGVRGTDFGIIATQLETRVVVFNGEVEVANKDRNILKSYIVRDREETRVVFQQPPETPVVVPDDVLSKWFDTYFIDEKRNVIIKRKQEGGIIDQILRKKDF